MTRKMRRRMAMKMAPVPMPMRRPSLGGIGAPRAGGVLAASAARTESAADAARARGAGARDLEGRAEGGTARADDDAQRPARRGRAEIETGSETGRSPRRGTAALRKRPRSRRRLKMIRRRSGQGTAATRIRSPRLIHLRAGGLQQRSARRARQQQRGKNRRRRLPRVRPRPPLPACLGKNLRTGIRTFAGRRTRNRARPRKMQPRKDEARRRFRSDGPRIGKSPIQRPIPRRSGVRRSGGGMPLRKSEGKMRRSARPTRFIGRPRRRPRRRPRGRPRQRTRTRPRR
mmetsp:Transcript_18471/g.40397  ORF Transcript_18471/g.40397 Transcript_18471/m.40397 type:complete len:287 (-) Transcript_18471:349-1209(-)